MKPARAFSILGIIILVIVLVVTIAGALTGFMAKDTVGLVFVIVISTTILSAVAYERVGKRRIRKRLTSRPQLNDEEFQMHFYSAELERGPLAVRVRRVLASNLGLPLDGLQPSDKLDDDLRAELAANPDLFWELEAEFSVRTDVEDVHSHEQSLKKLVTFDNLVDYITKRIREKPAEPNEDAPAAPTHFSQLCERALRCIPFLCVTGFVVVVIGALTRHSIMMKIGTALFLSGFAVWGLANGGGLCWTLVCAVREKGFRAVLAHPGIVLVLLVLGVFFLAIGGAFAWGIFRSLLQGK